MKIIRFRAPSHSYGYIRANFFERIYLRGRATADSGIYAIEGWEPGPKAYGAKFIIRAKETGYGHLLWRQDLVKKRAKKSILKKLLGSLTLLKTPLRITNVQN